MEMVQSSSYLVPWSCMDRMRNGERRTSKNRAIHHAPVRHCLFVCLWAIQELSSFPRRYLKGNLSSNKPGTQLCAAAKCEAFWRATGQSPGSFQHNSYASVKTKLCHPFVCQVWLPSGPPEFFNVSFRAWLCNWLSWDRMCFYCSRNYIFYLSKAKVLMGYWSLFIDQVWKWLCGM